MLGDACIPDQLQNARILFWFCLHHDFSLLNQWVLSAGRVERCATGVSLMDVKCTLAKPKLLVSSNLYNHIINLSVVNSRKNQNFREREVGLPQESET